VSFSCDCHLSGDPESQVASPVAPATCKDEPTIAAATSIAIDNLRDIGRILEGDDGDFITDGRGRV
jgi:hypothetical protein